jgi:glucan endo-1,3-beta-D-glucosidase
MPIWLTETGWPATGNATGASVPSLQNSQKYYKDIACASQIDGWYFVFNDPKLSIEPDFSLFNNQNEPIFDLNC